MTDIVEQAEAVLREGRMEQLAEEASQKVNDVRLGTVLQIARALVVLAGRFDFGKDTPGLSGKITQRLMAETTFEEEDYNEVLHPESVIYHADDTEMIQRAVRRVLSQDYKNLRSFEDGRLALDALLEALEKAEEPPRLVLSDMQMPNLDGVGLFRGLRKIEKGQRPRFVLLSDQGGSQRVKEALAEESFPILDKPSRGPDLRCMVNLMVNTHPALEEASTLMIAARKLAE